MLLLTCIEIAATPFLPRVQSKARIDLSDYYPGFLLHERRCTSSLRGPQHRSCPASVDLPPLSRTLLLASD